MPATASVTDLIGSSYALRGPLGGVMWMICLGLPNAAFGGMLAAFWFGYFFVFQVMVYVADCLVYRRAQALLRMLDERMLDHPAAPGERDLHLRELDRLELRFRQRAQGERILSRRLGDQLVDLEQQECVLAEQHSSKVLVTLAVHALR